MYTEEQYKFALNRIEKLLPLVTDETPKSDKNAIELALMSEIVVAYEEEHYPLDKLSVGELILIGLKEQNKTQKQLAEDLGISPSRVSDFIKGRGEPSLSLAGKICRLLAIEPALILNY